jgi:hypothetical protein
VREREREKKSESMVKITTYNQHERKNWRESKSFVPMPQEKYLFRHNYKYDMLDTHTTSKKIKKKRNKVIWIDVTILFYFNNFDLCVCPNLVPKYLCLGK